MRLALAQTVFNAGEITPRAFGRVDDEGYFDGCEALLNMIVLPEGGVTRRPGTEFLGEIKSSAAAGRLLPFITSSGRPIMIEAANLAFRYMDGDTGARLLTGGDPVETVTPWPTANLSGIYTWQLGDVMWLTHLSGGTAPRTLQYVSDTSWTVSVFTTRNGPFLAQNTGAVTLTPSAVTGSGVTLTASAPLFEAGHVGARFRLQENLGNPPHLRWTPFEGKGASTEGDDIHLEATTREYASRVYSTPGGNIAGNQPPVHDEGTVYDGGLNWTYLHDGAGVIRITAVTNSTTATGTVEERLPSTNATKYWSEGAFSPLRGWPRMGGFFEDRLVLMSTLAQPDTFFASRTGEYTPTIADFKERAGNGQVLDDNAIQRTLADGRVETPAWLVVMSSLLVGFSTAVKRLAGPSPDEPMTPAGMVARNFALRGVSQARAVATGDGAVLAASKDGRRVLEIAPDGAVTDLTARAEHVGGGRFVEFAWCGEPHRRLFGRTADERLYCLTYDPARGVQGWSRIVPGGAADADGAPPAVERIAPLEDGAREDRLWMIVRRRINGGTKRYIERLRTDWRGDREAADAACHLDSALRFAFEAPSATITGLAHLEGESVRVWGDGGDYGPFTVTGGEVTLPEPVSKGWVGLAHAWKMRSMPYDTRAGRGPTMGRMRRIERAHLRVFETVDGQVCAVGDRGYTFAPSPLAPREAGDLTDAPVPPRTRDISLTLQSGQQPRCQIEVSGAGAGPATILMAALEISVDD